MPRHHGLFRYCVLALAVAFLLVPRLASAQFDAATVLGTVADATGGVVPGATVTLKNAETGITAVTISDGEGRYQFLNVRIGVYSLRAELQGFSAAIADKIPVTVNARQRVDLTMKVGDVGETVEVTGAARLLESESSDRGQVIGHEQIVNLPLNGRAYADLALLSPGVRKSSISESRDGSFNVNGLRSSLNNFILDGVDNNSYGTSNQGFSNQVVQVSPDAVQEFKVQTNNFSAEFGRAGGAVINATFRSGTNQFRGTAWEFNRNTALNATGFFKPSSGVKPSLDRNQFGGVFGGPILRDKAFFFANYEGFRQVQKTVTFASIPTMAQREGVMGKPVRNPVTNELYADGIVPQSAITNFARQVLAGLPAPTRAGVANNFDSLPRRQDYNDKFDIKFDQQFNSATSAFVRFSYRDADNFEPPPIPGTTSSPSNGYVNILNQQLATGVTRTLGLTSLLEVRVGVSRTKAGKTAIGTGTPNMFDMYGITGLPTDTVFAGGLTQQSVSGWTAWGRQSSNPQFQDPLVWDARINYTWMRGQHTLKSGYEYQHINTDIDDVHPKYGADGYGGQFSRPTGAAADAATFNLVDFLVGARNTYELVNPFVFELRQRMHFGYVQDDWRATPDLTFNLGLRYEFGTPQWENGNNLTNFDPANNSLILARDGSLYDRTLVEPDKNNFAPRVGVAYSLNEQDGSPLGVRHELHSLQPARRREPAVVQRAARGPDRDHAAAVTRGVRAESDADELLQAHRAGISGGLERSGELRSAERPRQLHPAGHQHWQRQELARHRAARAVEQLDDRRGVHREPEPQPRHPRRLQSGASEQPRRGYSTAGAAADSRLSIHPVGVRWRQGELPRAADQGRAALLARPLSAQFVHLLEGARQCVRPPRDRQRRQQPRQLSRPRGRVGHLWLQPAGQQHDHAGHGPSVWPRSPLGQ